MTRKEKVLQFLKEAAVSPLLESEIAAFLDVKNEDRAQLYSVLEELCAEGYLKKTKRARYSYVEKVGMVRGEFISSEKGFGFVTSEELDEDIFIAPENVSNAMHRDIVLVEVGDKTKNGARKEGVIRAVVKRSDIPLVGVLQKGKKSGFVIADNKKILRDIYISEENMLGAKDGDKVMVRVLNWRDISKNPEGKIVEVLGKSTDIGIDILSVAKECGIKTEFSKKAIKEAKATEKDIPDEIIKERFDLTEKTIITIDGADAKDLDDAVSLEIKENGNFMLGVHIADVGHYVKYKSELDKEAYKRGTSVYLTDRVIPMLPKELSNGICSLNPHENRLTLSVMMEIDNSGNVISHSIAKSVICSKERMTYSNVAAILSGDRELSKRYKDIKEMLFLMKKLKNILRKKRKMRGSIDFDFPESLILLDENGKPTEIKEREITEANHIIEEFMLVCNETVAEHFFWQDIPFIFRVHEEPTKEKLSDFSEFLSGFGRHIKKTRNKIHPKEFQKLLDEIKGKREERIISSVMLRSLMKAKYTDENLGHFGLAAKYYCHFTSPIRRYPDLVIHRIIKDSIDGKIEGGEFSEFVRNAAMHASEAELTAMKAERECEDMKKAEYMENFIGDVFEGVISSVTSFGMFVELSNTVEGMVAFSELRDDYYVFDEKNHILVGREKNKIYRPGDLVKVKLLSSSKETRRIDFALFS